MTPERNKNPSPCIGEKWIRGRIQCQHQAIPRLEWSHGICTDPILYWLTWTCKWKNGGSFHGLSKSSGCSSSNSCNLASPGNTQAELTLPKFLAHQCIEDMIWPYGRIFWSLYSKYTTTYNLYILIFDQCCPEMAGSTTGSAKELSTLRIAAKTDPASSSRVAAQNMIHMDLVFFKGPKGVLRVSYMVPHLGTAQGPGSEHSLSHHLRQWLNLRNMPLRPK